MYDIDRKIIFTHPPKRAGTTVEMYFGWHPTTMEKTASPEDVKEFKRLKHATLEYQINEIADLGYNPDEFFKISCIRNPWDTAVSFYFHEKINAIKHFKIEHPNEPLPRYLQRISDMSFEEYVEYQYRREGYNFLEVSQFFIVNNANKIDYTIRHETFNEQLDYLLRKYNINSPKQYCGNGNTRPKDKHYKDYYTSTKHIKIIEELGKTTLELFNYTF